MLAKNMAPKKTQCLTLAISITYCKYNLCLIFYVFHVMRLSVIFMRISEGVTPYYTPGVTPYYTPYIPYYV